MTDNELNAAIAKMMGDEHRGWNHGFEYVSGKNAVDDRYPDYANDIGQAWRVVEKMQAEGWRCEMTWWPKRGLRVWFSFNNRAFRGEDAKPPRAVCLAALAAKGIETKEGVSA
jgi:Phage ABA sandwich domain